MEEDERRRQSIRREDDPGALERVVAATITTVFAIIIACRLIILGNEDIALAALEPPLSPERSRKKRRGDMQTQTSMKEQNETSSVGGSDKQAPSQPLELDFSLDELDDRTDDTSVMASEISSHYSNSGSSFPVLDTTEASMDSSRCSELKVNSAEQEIVISETIQHYIALPGESENKSEDSSSPVEKTVFTIGDTVDQVFTDLVENHKATKQDDAELRTAVERTKQADEDERGLEKDIFRDEDDEYSYLETISEEDSSEFESRKSSSSLSSTSDETTDDALHVSHQGIDPNQVIATAVTSCAAATGKKHKGDITKQPTDLASPIADFPESKIVDLSTDKVRNICHYKNFTESVDVELSLSKEFSPSPDSHLINNTTKMAAINAKVPEVVSPDSGMEDSVIVVDTDFNQFEVATPDSDFAGSTTEERLDAETAVLSADIIYADSKPTVFGEQPPQSFTYEYHKTVLLPSGEEITDKPWEAQVDQNQQDEFQSSEKFHDAPVTADAQVTDINTAPSVAKMSLPVADEVSTKQKKRGKYRVNKMRSDSSSSSSSSTDDSDTDSDTQKDTSDSVSTDSDQESDDESIKEPSMSEITTTDGDITNTDGDSEGEYEPNAYRPQLVARSKTPSRWIGNSLLSSSIEEVPEENTSSENEENRPATRLKPISPKRERKMMLSAAKDIPLIDSTVIDDNSSVLIQSKSTVASVDNNSVSEPRKIISNRQPSFFSINEPALEKGTVKTFHKAEADKQNKTTEVKGYVTPTQSAATEKTTKPTFLAVLNPEDVFRNRYRGISPTVEKPKDVHYSTDHHSEITKETVIDPTKKKILEARQKFFADGGLAVDNTGIMKSISEFDRHLQRLKEKNLIKSPRSPQFEDIEEYRQRMRARAFSTPTRLAIESNATQGFRQLNLQTHDRKPISYSHDDILENDVFQQVPVKFSSTSDIKILGTETKLVPVTAYNQPEMVYSSGQQVNRTYIETDIDSLLTSDVKRIEETDIDKTYIQNQESVETLAEMKPPPRSTASVPSSPLLASTYAMNRARSTGDLIDEKVAEPPENQLQKDHKEPKPEITTWQRFEKSSKLPKQMTPKSILKHKTSSETANAEELLKTYPYPGQSSQTPKSPKSIRISEPEVTSIEANELFSEIHKLAEQAREEAEVEKVKVTSYDVSSTKQTSLTGSVRADSMGSKLNDEPSANNRENQYIDNKESKLKPPQEEMVPFTTKDFFVSESLKVTSTMEVAAVVTTSKENIDNSVPLLKSANDTKHDTMLHQDMLSEVEDSLPVPKPRSRPSSLQSSADTEEGVDVILRQKPKVAPVPKPRMSLTSQTSTEPLTEVFKIESSLPSYDEQATDINFEENELQINSPEQYNVEKAVHIEEKSISAEKKTSFEENLTLHIDEPVLHSFNKGKPPPLPPKPKGFLPFSSRFFPKEKPKESKATLQTFRPQEVDHQENIYSRPSNLKVIHVFQKEIEKSVEGSYKPQIDEFKTYLVKPKLPPKPKKYTTPPTLPPRKVQANNHQPAIMEDRMGRKYTFTSATYPNGIEIEVPQTGTIVLEHFFDDEDNQNLIGKDYSYPKKAEQKTKTNNTKIIGKKLAKTGKLQKSPKDKKLYKLKDKENVSTNKNSKPLPPEPTYFDNEKVVSLSDADYYLINGQAIPTYNIHVSEDAVKSISKEPVYANVQAAGEPHSKNHFEDVTHKQNSLEVDNIQESIQETPDKPTEVDAKQAEQTANNVTVFSDTTHQTTIYLREKHTIYTALLDPTGNIVEKKPASDADIENISFLDAAALAKSVEGTYIYGQKQPDGQLAKANNETVAQYKGLPVETDIDALSDSDVLVNDSRSSDSGSRCSTEEEEEAIKQLESDVESMVIKYEKEDDILFDDMGRPLPTKIDINKASQLSLTRFDSREPEEIVIAHTLPVTPMVEKEQLFDNDSSCVGFVQVDSQGRPLTVAVDSQEIPIFISVDSKGKPAITDLQGRPLATTLDVQSKPLHRMARDKQGNPLKAAIDAHGKPIYVAADSMGKDAAVNEKGVPLMVSLHPNACPLQIRLKAQCDILYAAVDNYGRRIGATDNGRPLTVVPNLKSEPVGLIVDCLGRQIPMAIDANGRPVYVAIAGSELTAVDVGGIPLQVMNEWQGKPLQMFVDAHGIPIQAVVDSEEHPVYSAVDVQGRKVAVSKEGIPLYFIEDTAAKPHQVTVDAEGRRLMVALDAHGRRVYMAQNENGQQMSVDANGKPLKIAMDSKPKDLLIIKNKFGEPLQKGTDTQGFPIYVAVDQKGKHVAVDEKAVPLQVTVDTKVECMKPLLDSHGRMMSIASDVHGRPIYIAEDIQKKHVIVDKMGRPFKTYSIYIPAKPIEMQRNSKGEPKQIGFDSNKSPVFLGLDKVGDPIAINIEHCAVLMTEDVSADSVIRKRDVHGDHVQVAVDVMQNPMYTAVNSKDTITVVNAKGTPLVISDSIRPLVDKARKPLQVACDHFGAPVYLAINKDGKYVVVDSCSMPIRLEKCHDALPVIIAVDEQQNPVQIACDSDNNAVYIGSDLSGADVVVDSTGQPLHILHDLKLKDDLHDEHFEAAVDSRGMAIYLKVDDGEGYALVDEEGKPVELTKDNNAAKMNIALDDKGNPIEIGCDATRKAIYAAVDVNGREVAVNLSGEPMYIKVDQQPCSLKALSDDNGKPLEAAVDFNGQAVFLALDKEGKYILVDEKIVPILLKQDDKASSLEVAVDEAEDPVEIGIDSNGQAVYVAVDNRGREVTVNLKGRPLVICNEDNKLPVSFIQLSKPSTLDEMVEETDKQQSIAVVGKRDPLPAAVDSHGIPIFVTVKSSGMKMLVDENGAPLHLVYDPRAAPLSIRKDKNSQLECIGCDRSKKPIYAGCGLAGNTVTVNDHGRPLKVFADAEQKHLKQKTDVYGKPIQAATDINDSPIFLAKDQQDRDIVCNISGQPLCLIEDDSSPPHSVSLDEKGRPIQLAIDSQYKPVYISKQENKTIIVDALGTPLVIKVNDLSGILPSDGTTKTESQALQLIQDENGRPMQVIVNADGKPIYLGRDTNGDQIAVDHEGRPVEVISNYDTVPLTVATDDSGELLCFALDAKGIPLYLAVDNRGKQVAVDEKGYPLRTVVDVQMAVDSEGKPLIVVVDSLNKPIYVSVDFHGNHIAVDCQGRRLRAKVDETKPLLNVETDSEGRAFQIAVDSHGKPLLMAVDTVGRKVAVDGHGMPIMANVDTKSNLLLVALNSCSKPLHVAMDAHNREVTLDRHQRPLNVVTNHEGYPLSCKVDVACTSLNIDVSNQPSAVGVDIRGVPIYLATTQHGDHVIVDACGKALQAKPNTDSGTLQVIVDDNKRPVQIAYDSQKNPVCLAMGHVTGLLQTNENDTTITQPPMETDIDAILSSSFEPAANVTTSTKLQKQLEPSKINESVQQHPEERLPSKLDNKTSSSPTKTKADSPHLMMPMHNSYDVQANVWDGEEVEKTKLYKSMPALITEDVEKTIRVEDNTYLMKEEHGTFVIEIKMVSKQNIPKPSRTKSADDILAAVEHSETSFLSLPSKTRNKFPSTPGSPGDDDVFVMPAGETVPLHASTPRTLPLQIMTHDISIDELEVEEHDPVNDPGNYELMKVMCTFKDIQISTYI